MRDDMDCDYRCKSVEPHGRLGKEIILKTIIPISQSGSLESGTSPGNIVTNERRCYRGGIYAN